MTGAPLEVPPGREIESAAGRRYTIWIERADVAPVVTRTARSGRLGPRLSALFHRAEHTLRTRSGWRLLVREGGVD